MIHSSKNIDFKATNSSGGDSSFQKQPHTSADLVERLRSKQEQPAFDQPIEVPPSIAQPNKNPLRGLGFSTPELLSQFPRPPQSLSSNLSRRAAKFYNAVGTRATSEGKAGKPDGEMLMTDTTLPLQLNKNKERNTNMSRDRQISHYEARHQADIAYIERARLELAVVLQQRSEAEDQARVARLEGELKKMVKEQLTYERHCRVLERKNRQLKAKICEQQVTLQATILEMCCKRTFGQSWISPEARRLIMQKENATHPPVEY